MRRVFFGFGSMMFLTAAAVLASAYSAMSAQVNIYSSQKEHLIKPLLDQFSQKTGIAVNLTTGKSAPLLARLEAEGDATPADIFMIADVANLSLAAQKNLLSPVVSEALQTHIPDAYRSEDNTWFGFTTRVRAMYHRKGEPLPQNMRYEDLATDAWKDAVLISSSSKVYNQSLMASRIAHLSEEGALAWAKGLVKNMARMPQGDERDQLRALASGQGKVAVANSYYFGLLANAGDEKDAEYAEKIAIFFPNQSGDGTHANIRGAGMTAHAKNTDEAKQLLEYFISEEAQKFFAEKNYEYPVRSGIAPNETVAAWGDFKRDELPLSKAASQLPLAVKLMDRAGWK